MSVLVVLDEDPVAAEAVMDLRTRVISPEPIRRVERSAVETFSAFVASGLPR